MSVVIFRCSVVPCASHCHWHRLVCYRSYATVLYTLARSTCTVRTRNSASEKCGDEEHDEVRRDTAPRAVGARVRRAARARELAMDARGARRPAADDGAFARRDATRTGGHRFARCSANERLAAWEQTPRTSLEVVRLHQLRLPKLRVDACCRGRLTWISAQVAPW